jgi:hypothetical protein
MSLQFVDYSSLEDGVVYMAQSFQYLYSSTGYFYVLRITKPGGVEYRMNIQKGMLEDNIYGYLEGLRVAAQKKRFSFTKSSVQVSSTVSAPCIIIAGVNDVVGLN